MDTITCLPDRVRLDPVALARCQESMEVEILDRTIKKGSKTKAVSFTFFGRALLKVCFTLCPDSEYRISKVTCEAPKLIFGHNARLIATEPEWLLSLTRIWFLLSLITRAEDHPRLLPGLGEDNYGYWNRIDVAVHQIDDGSLLLKSHGFRSPGGKLQPLVVAGESTTLRSRGGPVEIRIYDKGLQMGGTKSGRKDAEICLRIETSFKNSSRFSKAIEQVCFQDTVVRTFTLTDALVAHRHALAPLVPLAVESQPQKGKEKMVAFIVKLLPSTDISADRLVEEWVALLGTKGSKTAQRLRKGVSESLAQSARASLLRQTTLDDLQRAPVIAKRPLESSYKKTIKAWGLPGVPSPEIVAAYSKRNISWGKPSRGALLGF